MLKVENLKRLVSVVNSVVDDALSLDKASVFRSDSAT